MPYYEPFLLDDSPAAKNLREAVHEDVEHWRERLPRVFITARLLQLMEVGESGREAPPDLMKDAAWRVHVHHSETLAIRAIKELGWRAFCTGEALSIRTLYEISKRATEMLELVAERQPEATRKALHINPDELADANASSSLSRNYALAAHLTIRNNQELHRMFRRLATFGLRPALRAKPPKWAIECSALPVFNKTAPNFDAWWGVAKSMLQDRREAMLNEPEWKSIASGRDRNWQGKKVTASVKFAAILDGIRHSFMTIAPP
jgi:hypothetical protein